MVSHDPSIRTFGNLTLMHWERRTVAAAAADCRPSALSDSGFAEALTQALCSGWRFLRLVWRTCIQRLSDILLVPVHRLLRPGVRVFRLIEIGIQPPSSHSSDACRLTRDMIATVARPCLRNGLFVCLLETHAVEFPC
jgi:hypothetical protein